MGTHNRLLKLGENTYLEVIAINPAAAKPQRPRWFGLDSLTSDSPPRLTAWVARTPDIEGTYAASTASLGTILPMYRGDLEWRITVPDDGNLIFGGIVPMLIEWKRQPHPVARLPESGCILLRLEGFAADPTIAGAALESIQARKLLKLQRAAANAPPSLVAHVNTSNGPKTLGPE